MFRAPTSSKLIAWKEFEVIGLKFVARRFNGSRRPPNGSRPSQRVAHVAFLNCGRALNGSRTTQRVAHLVRRVAPLSAARNCSSFAPFSQSLSLSLLQALECTMRVKGGNLGFYKSHLKKFHLQTHFLMFFLLTLYNTDFWFPLSWIWLIECFDLILFAGRSSEGLWQGDLGYCCPFEDFLEFHSFYKNLTWTWL